MDACMLCFGCKLGNGKGLKEAFLNALHHCLRPIGLKCLCNAGLHQTNTISM
jgi:hypothetical protein